MAALTYQIKKQERFNEEFREAIPKQEIAEDILNGLFFALRHFPERGIPTGRSAPSPVYAWRIQGTERNPPLIVYYCFQHPIVLLFSAHVTEQEET